MQTSFHTLSSGVSALQVDSAGRLTSLVLYEREWITAPLPLWQLVLQDPGDQSVIDRQRPLPASQLAAPAPETIEQEGQSLRLRYASLPFEQETVAIDLTLTITAEDQGFAFRYAIDNQSAWTVRELRGPALAASLAASTESEPALLWPMGAGERVTEPARLGVRHDPYPSRLTMPWLALHDDRGGLYFGCHEPETRTIYLNADSTRVDQALVLSASLFPFCAPGAAWESCTVMLAPFEGSWHAAAKRYRQWAESGWQHPAPAAPAAPAAHSARPDWITRVGGMLLVILKQQNGEIHWSYQDLDRISELSAESGCDLVCLYGWTVGGHDRFYPVYEPDPAMGGEEALRAGIKRLQAAGQRVVLYTNGQLLDMQGDWFGTHGMEVAAVSERGEPFGEMWHKYKDAPGRLLACACQQAPAWSDHLVALARQVQGLGADGIIYDQIGAGHPPFCFGTGHGHDNPAASHGPGVVANMRRVQQEMAAIDPDFAIMVEHTTDTINQHVDLTHGCHIGFNACHGSFPEMLRYTFPEMLVTLRCPTPVISRTMANWATFYGWPLELEYRYWPDRLYGDQGILPLCSDYERVIAPPNVPLMQQTKPRTAYGYLAALAAFVKKHADLLRLGRFRDTLGFTNGNPTIRAKAWCAGNQLGILLWNPTDTPQHPQLEVPDAIFNYASEPGHLNSKSTSNHAQNPIDPTTPIAPDSLRLMLYTKKG